jgi:hypothetical protein
MHCLRSLPTFAKAGGIWIILVEELPHAPVLTTFLPSPAPPIIATAAEQEYQDYYHNKLTFPYLPQGDHRGGFALEWA